MSTLGDALKGKKIVFGTDRTMKLLKNDKLKTVFLASNCDKDVKGDIEYYAKINKTEVVELNMKNNEVGVFCKKPFSISVVSVEK